MIIPRVDAPWERHGLTRTPEHIAWMAMKSRCYNVQNKDYRHYGGRGIGVCVRWQESFLAFLEDMGNRPYKEASIDRIDVNGNYEPLNCRWASKSVQAQNIRKPETVVMGNARGKLNHDLNIWEIYLSIENQEYKLGSYLTISDTRKLLRSLNGLNI